MRLPTLDPRKRALEDPAFFIATYFGDKIEQLKDFQLNLIENATMKDLCLILYPAGHGKTTLVSTILPIWALCRDPNIRIAVIGKNESEAKDKIARVIMAELMGNERLIRDFGPFVPSEDNKAWSLTSLTVEKRTIRAKEPTLAFFGSGSKGTLGHRANWVICDDVVTDKNSATETQRESMLDWFNLSVDTMMLPGGRLTVVGTRFDPNDLYGHILSLQDPEEGLPIYHVQHEDAIVDEENRIPLWPEFWPWKKLMQKKASAGTIAFNKRYRNIAVDSSSMAFRESFVKGGYDTDLKQRYPGCLDRDYIVGDRADDWSVYSGFDPAMGATRHAKFCSHITVAVGSCAEHERCLWVVDLVRDQLTLPQQVELILTQHERYNIASSRIEANSYQKGLLEAAQAKMNDLGVAFRLEPHFTNAQNKPDPELGVASMGPWFENGLVHIPWGNPESMRKMQRFVDELIMYPAKPDDTVMSFWFAWRATQEGVNKFRSYNRLDQDPRKHLYRKATRRGVFINPAFR